VQIIDRFTTVYNWNPVDFTEKGNPTVDDDVLRTLIGHIPMAEELAEVFYYNKRLSQLKTGAKAWLKKVQPDGKIHAYVNVGGTISGRASHVDPNLAQVPKVKYVKAVDADGNVILNAKGKPKEVVGLGRAGDHGFECRSLFYVPAPWKMMGIDMSGIELRCFGEKLSKYDGGEYLNLVLSGDPHSYNQQLAELPTRDNAKTFIYALLYGAGDIKLGSIVAPLADEEEQRAIGVRLRARFMSGLPAYALLVKEIKRYARSGFIPGLDGRKLYVRSPHSALNVWLQSDAALLSKKWITLTVEKLEAHGLRHGWDGDFVQLLWIHDECQSAIKPEISELFSETSVLSAKEAGKFFNYNCPIDVVPKIGQTWAECH
jgi:DNA polymerase I-like protein with 3'-5' exonuclease and polymerase domains